MGNRLSKIVTRTGDDGSTGLGDSSRIGKDSKRIQLIGEVDELNTFLGLLLTEDLPENMRENLKSIQHTLFDLGGEFSIPVYTAIKTMHIERLDELLHQYNADLAPLKEFILPGGSRAAALAHVCRTVCRRAERALVGLAREEKTNPMALQYLNRLSDLFFVLARKLNQQAAQEEEQWSRMMEVVNT